MANSSWTRWSWWSPSWSSSTVWYTWWSTMSNCPAPAPRCPLDSSPRRRRHHLTAQCSCFSPGLCTQPRPHCSTYVALLSTGQRCRSRNYRYPPDWRTTWQTTPTTCNGLHAASSCAACSRDSYCCVSAQTIAFRTPRTRTGWNQRTHDGPQIPPSGLAGFQYWTPLITWLLSYIYNQRCVSTKPWICCLNCVRGHVMLCQEQVRTTLYSPSVECKICTDESSSDWSHDKSSGFRTM